VRQKSIAVIAAVLGGLLVLPGAAGASSSIFGRPHVTSKGIVFSITTDETGTLTIESGGLEPVSAPIEPGGNHVTALLSRQGRDKRRHHRRIYYKATFKTTQNVTATSTGFIKP
jgi:hypothetical protein